MTEVVCFLVRNEAFSDEDVLQRGIILNDNHEFMLRNDVERDGYCLSGLNSKRFILEHEFILVYLTF
jgi:hypothetical protein